MYTSRTGAIYKGEYIEDRREGWGECQKWGEVTGRGGKWGCGGGGGEVAGSGGSREVIETDRCRKEADERRHKYCTKVRMKAMEIASMKISSERIVLSKYSACFKFGLRHGLVRAPPTYSGEDADEMHLFVRCTVSEFTTFQRSLGPLRMRVAPSSINAFVDH
jgi:hypothetical protein